MIHIGTELHAADSHIILMLMMLVMYNPQSVNSLTAALLIVTCACKCVSAIYVLTAINQTLIIFC